MYFLNFVEREFTAAILAFLCGKHCARVAGVIIKHVRVPAKFWPIEGLG